MQQLVYKINLSSWICLFLCVGLCIGCSDEELRQGDGEDSSDKIYEIAVVLPYSSGMEEHWHRVIDWALANVNHAFKEEKVQIKARWYNEDTEDMETLFADLSGINAVIGPLYSANVVMAAAYCNALDIPLIPASATSEELMRAFSAYGGLWCLTENDISQSELLLTTALRKGARSVSLLTDAGIYGKTFFDWITFQAKEMGVEVHSVVQYTSAPDLDDKMKRLLQEDTDCLICVPTDDFITHRMNALRNEHSSARAFLLFSDVAFLAPPDEEFEGMEGVAQSQNPFGAFNLTYEEKYGNPPGYAASHFYDAVVLVGLAIWENHLTGKEDVNMTLRHIVTGVEGEVDWRETGISAYTDAIRKGQHPHLSGASGDLRFDALHFTNVLHSYYCHWVIRGGKRVILEYTTSNSSQRTDPSLSNWNWDVMENQQSFPQIQFTYPPLRNLHVLIVAASNGWQNYRHQADAYAFYQILRKNGVPDERIVLIAEDDIVLHPSNPKPGYVATSPEGENVYKDVHIDYHPTTLQACDLHAILSGTERPYLREVIISDSSDNLLVYWVGHGSSDGKLGWGERTFAMNDLAAYLRDVTEHKKFRKVLVAMEACYSGIFGNACKGIEGLLCLTATTEKEVSKTCRFNASLRVWMSNYFSENLRLYLNSSAGVSLYDLYSGTYRKTIGSHVSVYNAEHFGNLYLTRTNEFLNR